MTLLVSGQLVGFHKGLVACRAPEALPAAVVAQVNAHMLIQPIFAVKSLVAELALEGPEAGIMHGQMDPQVVVVPELLGTVGTADARLRLGAVVAVIQRGHVSPKAVAVPAAGLWIRIDFYPNPDTAFFLLIRIQHLSSIEIKLSYFLAKIFIQSQQFVLIARTFKLEKNFFLYEVHI
jgi:hypothetical protein